MSHTIKIEIPSDGSCMLCPLRSSFDLCNRFKENLRLSDMDEPLPLKECENSK